MSQYATTHLQSFFGIAAIVAIGWFLSENRSTFPIRLVASGLFVCMIGLLT